MVNEKSKECTFLISKGVLRSRDHNLDLFVFYSKPSFSRRKDSEGNEPFVAFSCFTSYVR